MTASRIIEATTVVETRLLAPVGVIVSTPATSP